MTFRPSRREVLMAGAAATAGMASGALPDVLLRAMAAGPGAGKLSDIQHVVFLIQENRSFDHYFGAYHGARGLNEYVSGVATAAGRTWNEQYTAQDLTASGATVAPPNPMRPFHLDTSAGGACSHDIDHQWVTQHKTWNGGLMDKFLSAHLAFDSYTGTAGPSVPPNYANGPLTMGYYNRSDLPFYYALADNFTLCDNYHTAAITGSASNWIYAFSGMIDPAGQLGGPVLSTPTTGNTQDYFTKYYGKMKWTTMPERLEAKGISWKVYGSPDFVNPVFNDNFLVFFDKFAGPGLNPTLTQKAFGDVNWAGGTPTSFMLDCQLDRLPQVSWLVAPEIWSEHPPTPSALGQDLVHNIVTALASNQNVWNKTALFITWDDSGGWFDHVSPITAPPGTQGEYLTCTDAQLYDRLPWPAAQPLPPEGRQVIGLGFRVPMLIISPWTRNASPSSGPLIASQASTGEVYDHTSMLRFLETLFCVEAPNLTAWRRETVGDLTGAFNFAAPDTSVPQLPATLAATTAALLTQECIAAPSMTEGNHGLYAYKFPANIPVPSQEPLPEEGSVHGPSGQVLASGCVPPANPPGGGSNAGSTPVGAGGDLPNTAVPPSLVAGGAAAVTALAVAGWAARRSRSQLKRSLPVEAGSASPPEDSQPG
ncbi:MAG: alkaline phosphatase family protein [Candidatus Dormiibacterota bacterium]